MGGPKGWGAGSTALAGFTSPPNIRRREVRSMRAWDLMYALGNALHKGLTHAGVSRFHADQWYSRWCVEVQDPLLEDDCLTEGAAIRLVQCLTDARNTMGVWGRE